MSKAAFNKKNALFNNKFELNLSHKVINFYIWGIRSYGIEHWGTLGNRSEIPGNL